jgi:hypothetical protein
MHNPKVTYQNTSTANNATPQELPQLNSLDFACFGADRKKLLTALFKNPQTLLFCMKNAGDVTGFVACKVFGETAELGPLVCGSVDVALQLILAALSTLDGLAVSVYLPSNLRSLCEMLIGLGFVEDFRLIRMFWGKPKSAGCIYMAESLERG